MSYFSNKALGRAKDHFQFAGLNEEPHLASMIEFPYKPNSTFNVGIIIPKSDIMENINKISIIMLAGIFCFLVIAIAIGFYIAKTLSRSLTTLAGEVDKVSKLDLSYDGGSKTRILEVYNISESVVKMIKGLKSFKKYVPADLVVRLNEQHREAALLGGEKKELTIFFSDIMDFTSISEQLSTEKLVENLGVYFNGLSRIILEEKGTLDKYIGDSIMAFWGAPVERQNHATAACVSALKCQAFLTRLEPIWRKTKQPLFHTRIGIHTGEVIVGNFGFEERMNYTILGDNVNFASRLEGLNKFYGTRVLISEDTYEKVEDNFVARRLDYVEVKGKTGGGVFIYELVVLRGSAPIAISSSEHSLCRS